MAASASGRHSSERRHRQGGLWCAHQVELHGPSAGVPWAKHGNGFGALEQHQLAPWHATNRPPSAQPQPATAAPPAPPLPVCSCRVEVVDRLTGRLVPNHDPLALQVVTAAAAWYSLPGSACVGGTGEILWLSEPTAQLLRGSDLGLLATSLAQTMPGPLLPALLPSAAVRGGRAGARKPAGGWRQQRRRGGCRLGPDHTAAQPAGAWSRRAVGLFLAGRLAARHVGSLATTAPCRHVPVTCQQPPPTGAFPARAAQGRPLLAAKSAPSDARGYVLVPLVGGTAQLPDLSVTGG